jgi:hypothetical protein
MAWPRGPAYRPRMRRSLAALLLVACTTAPQWTKEGASKESAEADLQLCKDQAPIAPRTQGVVGMPSGVGGERKAAFNTMAEREASRMQKDERFVAECMRGKGYDDK